MLQTEITKQEKKLAELDKYDSESESTSDRFRTAYRAEGWDTEQMELREQLQKNLLMYWTYSLSKVLKANANLGLDDLLLKQAQLRIYRKH